MTAVIGIDHNERPLMCALQSSRLRCCRLFTFIVSAFIGCFIADVTANDLTPTPVLPSQLSWAGPPNNSALKAAWIVGSEHAAGLYQLRVKLAQGGQIPPHTHPDTRNSTVLAGTLYVGFGPRFDESKVVAIPTGGLYVAPANVPHYLWAKDGEVEYQEAGIGPTATVPLAP